MNFICLKTAENNFPELDIIRLWVFIPASTAHVVKRKLVRDKMGRTRRYDFGQMSRLPCNSRFKCELIRKQNSDDKANFNFLQAPKSCGQSISYDKFKDCWFQICLSIEK